MRRLLLACLVAAAVPLTAAAQDVTAVDDAKLDEVLGALENLGHRLDELQKQVDDGLWFDRVGDVAHVDKVRLYGPPKWKACFATF